MRSPARHFGPGREAGPGQQLSEDSRRPPRLPGRAPRRPPDTWKGVRRAQQELVTATTPAIHHGERTPRAQQELVTGTTCGDREETLCATRTGEPSTTGGRPGHSRRTGAAGAVPEHRAAERQHQTD